MSIDMDYMITDDQVRQIAASEPGPAVTRILAGLKRLDWATFDNGTFRRQDYSTWKALISGIRRLRPGREKSWLVRSLTFVTKAAHEFWSVFFVLAYGSIVFGTISDLLGLPGEQFSLHSELTAVVVAFVVINLAVGGVVLAVAMLFRRFRKEAFFVPEKVNPGFLITETDIQEIFQQASPPKFALDIFDNLPITNSYGVDETWVPGSIVSAESTTRPEESMDPQVPTPEKTHVWERLLNYARLFSAFYLAINQYIPGQIETYPISAVFLLIFVFDIVIARVIRHQRDRGMATRPLTKWQTS